MSRLIDLFYSSGFNSWDYMEIGEIENKKFRTFLAAASDLSKAEIKQAVADIDTEQKGTINYQEFLKWYLEDYPLICLQLAIDSYEEKIGLPFVSQLATKHHSTSTCEYHNFC